MRGKERYDARDLRYSFCDNLVGTNRDSFLQLANHTVSFPCTIKLHNRAFCLTPIHGQIVRGHLGITSPWKRVSRSYHVDYR